MKDYRYRVYLTNHEEDKKTIWDGYRQRADDENRIKELTHDFGLDEFCLHRFFATEAAILANVLLYNLFNLFRHEVLPPCVFRSMPAGHFAMSATHSGACRPPSDFAGNRPLF